MVRLKDNTLRRQQAKMIKDYVGKFSEVTGEIKLKSGEMAQSANPLEVSSIPRTPQPQAADVRHFKAKGSPEISRRKRHELAMPYISQYYFISFTMVAKMSSDWLTVRQTNWSEAYNRIKMIEGVKGCQQHRDTAAGQHGWTSGRPPGCAAAPPSRYF